MLDSHQCTGHEQDVQERVANLEDQWKQLLAKSAEKSQKLKEANQQQQFNSGVKDVLFWLGEVCGYDDKELEVSAILPYSRHAHALC